MVKIAMIATSAKSWTTKGGSEVASGCWMEELATPFLAFKAAGYDVMLCSIKGGEVSHTTPHTAPRQPPC
jgi:hypothetical protein